MSATFPVGVIGAGAMGMGVVQSLLRGGIATHVRDIRAEVQAQAAAAGATAHPSPAALAAATGMIIVLVVDAAEIETVLFDADGVVHGLRPEGIVVIASTVDPEFVATLPPRLRVVRAHVVDAPVSGGPRRAGDGTMTMMTAGDAAVLGRCAPVFAAIAGRVFNVGTSPGDAAKFKIINNLLAAVNLAAGAEALALAAKAGLDPRQMADVVSASSGASWIFDDRMPRALAGDYAPRAAARILHKDVRLATAFAARHGVNLSLGDAAEQAFAGMVAGGLGEEDDAAIYKYSRRRAGVPD